MQPPLLFKAFAAALGVKPGSTGGFLAAKPPIWDRPAFVLWTAGASNPTVEEARWVSEDPAAFKGVKEMWVGLGLGRSWYGGKGRVM